MILADEHIPAKIIAAIRAIPFEVISVREVYKSEADNKLIELAQVQSLIIITEDKDFGEWVFAHHLPTAGVIFFRYQL